MHARQAALIARLPLIRWNGESTDNPHSAATPVRRCANPKAQRRGTDCIGGLRQQQPGNLDRTCSEPYKVPMAL
jgi:hypothetical protein